MSITNHLDENSNPTEDIEDEAELSESDELEEEESEILEEGDLSDFYVKPKEHKTVKIHFKIGGKRRHFEFDIKTTLGAKLVAHAEKEATNMDTKSGTTSVDYVAYMAIIYPQLVVRSRPKLTLGKLKTFDSEYFEYILLTLWQEHRKDRHVQVDRKN